MHDELRAAIGELRSTDEREAPAFGELVSRVPQPLTIEAWRVARAAGTASVLIALVVGITYRVSTRRDRIVVPSEVSALSSWQPITDALLATPNANVLMETPRLDASVLSIPIAILEDGQ